MAENSSVWRLFRRRVENEFQVLAEAEVEHLVGFVEHDGGKLAEVEAVAFQVVAQAPGRADDDMGALGKLAGFGAPIHAADAGHDTRARVLVEPVELALHLHGELARGRDDQSQRLGGLRQPLRLAEQCRSDGQSEGNRLPGAGLRGNEQIAPGIGFEHRQLHGGWDGIAARAKGAPERGMNRREGHEERHFSNMGRANGPGDGVPAHAAKGSRDFRCLAGFRQTNQQTCRPG